MECLEYLNQIINEGIDAARRDYTKPRDASKLKGSIAGFEACRGLQPLEIAVLLNTCQDKTRIGLHDSHANRITTDEYWEIRCFELEVEWVANCVSAVLMNQGLPVIVNPTARGMMKAAEIVGVTGA